MPDEPKNGKDIWQKIVFWETGMLVSIGLFFFLGGASMVENVHMLGYDVNALKLQTEKIESHQKDQDADMSKMWLEINKLQDVLIITGKGDSTEDFTQPHKKHP
jgi:hypothetical protein